MQRSAARARCSGLVGCVVVLLTLGAALPNLAGATEAAAEPAEVTATQSAAPWGPRQAAWADGISTALALSNGAFERNPLIGSSPASLLAVTGAKLGLVEWVERSDLAPEKRQRTLKALSAMWGGASINNLLVLLSAQPAVALLAGMAGGWWLWRAEDDASAGLPVRSAQVLPPIAAEPPERQSKPIK